MDHKFTEQIKQWLETPEAERDYTVGALYLLKLSGNKIMYMNLVANLDRRHDFVEYQLQSITTSAFKPSHTPKSKARFRLITLLARTPSDTLS